MAATRIITREGDREITVRQSTWDGDIASLNVEELGTGGVAVYSYLTREKAIELIRAVAATGDITAEEIFPTAPKNARDLIDQLPVGAAFTLSREGGTRSRYFRKTEEETVQEYQDDALEFTGAQQWKLKGSSGLRNGLFTSWTVSEFAEYTPPTWEEVWDETWARLKRGDTFHFGGESADPKRVHIKISDTHYDHDYGDDGLLAGNPARVAILVQRFEGNTIIPNAAA